MKKLSQLFFISTILLSLSFVACGSDDDNKDGDGLEIQDYTSFIIENNYEKGSDFYKMIIAYQDDYKKLHKIEDIETLLSGKISKEIILKNYYSKIRIIALFKITDDDPFYVDFDIKENRKNILRLEGDLQWTRIEDTTDPKQYPQE